MKSWLAACVLASLAAPAAAQFDLFPWNYTPGGDDSYGSVSAASMYIEANFGDPLAFQGFTATAPVAGRVAVKLDHYMTWDGQCGACVPVFSEDGVLTMLATCTASDKFFAFEVEAGSEFGFGLKTNQVNWPGQVWFTEFRFTPANGLEYWTDLGQSLGGQLGPPNLAAQGLLHGGMPIKLKVTNAAPHQPAVLVIGLSALDAPFKGGVMVPTPDLLVSGLLVGMGTLNLSATWPNGLPPGLQLWMQSWIVDPTAPFGLSATNAMLAATP